MTIRNILLIMIIIIMITFISVVTANIKASWLILQVLGFIDKPFILRSGSENCSHDGW